MSVTIISTVILLASLIGRKQTVLCKKNPTQKINEKKDYFNVAIRMYFQFNYNKIISEFLHNTAQAK